MEHAVHPSEGVRASDRGRGAKEDEHFSQPRPDHVQHHCHDGQGVPDRDPDPGGNLIEKHSLDAQEEDHISEPGRDGKLVCPTQDGPDNLPMAEHQERCDVHVTAQPTGNEEAGAQHVPLHEQKIQDGFDHHHHEEVPHPHNDDRLVPDPPDPFHGNGPEAAHQKRSNVELTAQQTGNEQEGSQHVPLLLEPIGEEKDVEQESNLHEQSIQEGFDYEEVPHTHDPVHMPHDQTVDLSIPVNQPEQDVEEFSMKALIKVQPDETGVIDMPGHKESGQQDLNLETLVKVEIEQPIKMDQSDDLSIHCMDLLGGVNPLKEEHDIALPPLHEGLADLVPAARPLDEVQLAPNNAKRHHADAADTSRGEITTTSVVNLALDSVTNKGKSYLYLWF